LVEFSQKTNILFIQEQLTQYELLTKYDFESYASSMMIEQEDLKRAEIFKTLSDVNRLSIIRTLYIANREMTCGEIGQQLDISKSTVSYHFKMLRAVGLTHTRRSAQSKYLSLNYQNFNKYLPGFLDSL